MAWNHECYGSSSQSIIALDLSLKFKFSFYNCRNLIHVSSVLCLPVQVLVVLKKNIRIDESVFFSY